MGHMSDIYPSWVFTSVFFEKVVSIFIHAYCTYKNMYFMNHDNVTMFFFCVDLIQCIPGYGNVLSVMIQ